MITALNKQINFANKIISRYGYDQTELISYVFNNNGFRDNKNYNFLPEIIFFGGSTFFGVGVPFTNSIPYIVSQTNDLKYWNCTYAHEEYNNEIIFNTIKQSYTHVKNIPIVVQWVGNAYQPITRKKVEFYINKSKKLFPKGFHCIIDGNFEKELIDQKIVDIVNPVFVDVAVDKRNAGIKTHKNIASYISHKLKNVTST